MEQSLEEWAGLVHPLTKNHDLRLFISCWSLIKMCSFVYTKVHLVFSVEAKETGNGTEITYACTTFFVSDFIFVKPVIREITRVHSEAN